MSGFDAEKFTEAARAAWSDSAGNYHKIGTDYFTAVADAFIGFAGVEPGQSVLDVACGPGTATFPAARRAGPKGRVTATDLAPGMLALARAEARREGLHNVEFLESSAERLALPDKSFDVVVCQLGLMLFARPQAALTEMVRVARGGGTVACLVQGRAEGMVFTSLLNLTTFRHAPQLKIPGAPGLYNFGPQGALEQIFTACGLKHVRTERLTGTFPFASPDAYWDTMTNASGRMKNMLASLDPEITRVIRAEVLDKAKAYLKDGRLEMPYEFAMAAGVRA